MTTLATSSLRRCDHRDPCHGHDSCPGPLATGHQRDLLRVRVRHPGHPARRPNHQVLAHTQTCQGQRCPLLILPSPPLPPMHHHPGGDHPGSHTDIIANQKRRLRPQRPCHVLAPHVTPSEHPPASGSVQDPHSWLRLGPPPKHQVQMNEEALAEHCRRRLPRLDSGAKAFLRRRRG